MKSKQEASSQAVLPFLRWAGSKRQRRHILKSFWSDEFNRYVEPFAGSAALFFEIGPQKAILGDLNEELIETFLTVRDYPARVHHALASIPQGPSHYYKLRSVDPTGLTQIKRAARFIYLNRFCFNGLYRTNLQGGFNVPYGGAKSGNIPSIEHMKACGQALKAARLMKADFRDTLALVRKGDFVYLDPPYAVSNRRVFVEYGACLFTVDDLGVLGTHLREIDKCGAIFVASYADCSEAREAFAGWRVRRVLTRRSVAGFLGARRNHYEMFVTNYPRRHLNGWR